MITFNNFIDNNENISVIERRGIFTVYEHLTDLSVNPMEAQTKYFMSQMNCTAKQVKIELQNNAVRLFPGAMQVITGNVDSKTGITGAGDLLGKFVKSKMTGDTAIKPVYSGTGIIITEPTYLYPIVLSTAEFGGALTCDDSMFLACDDEVKDTVQARSNISSAVLGGEGLFNLMLQGSGYCVLKSHCPKEELFEVILENDVIKIDGNNAVAWSSSLSFTVERSSKTLAGSAVNGEGLVNVYRGTGRILMSPL